MTVAVRPDLSRRKALSKSELSSAALCQRRAYYARTDPRPWVPIEKVTFGAAVDAGVEVIATQLRAGQGVDLRPAQAAASAIVARDEIAVDEDGIGEAIERFVIDVAGRFDWAYVGTQRHIHLELPDIGEVDGHPDFVFADHSVYDLKTGARAKTPSDVRDGIELPFYALLREAETGTAPPTVGYITWVRVARPYWQVLDEPVTPAMLARARVWASQYAYAVRLNDRAGANVALIGTPRSWSLCADCQWADVCPLAVKEEPTDA